MSKFDFWVRLTPYQTTHIIIQADGCLEGKLMVESMYGVGSVLGWSTLSE